MVQLAMKTHSAKLKRKEDEKTILPDPFISMIITKNQLKWATSQPTKRNQTKMGRGHIPLGLPNE